MALQLALEPHLHESRLIASDFTQRLERIARKYTRGSTIVWEDAAQSAQMKVLQAVRSGKFRQGGADEFDRWALTVARFEIIDLVRKEKHRHCASLDAVIPGTDLALSETIAAEFDALDSLEQTDLVLQAIAAIQELDQRLPQRGYMTLWQGQVQGKTQTQLAIALGVSQGEASKRWKEMVSQVSERLGILRPEAIQQEHQAIGKRKGKQRRSTAQW
ncbi:sigma-70 family RNA polymerase sigma factor [Cyanobacteria bacterium FACHB-DQ100]|nr:sigma-70 family RNA polymerase sigma factor [Cyanobacteria bacterium FACHB-DQ100]